VRLLFATPTYVYIIVNLPGATAFVPQDDRLHGFYTCRKYMQHYARLAGLPRGAATEAKIDTLFKQLGLAGQADTIVGDIFLKGLSGGQKRRLSVALEALTEPNNFFLDEPTSGLGNYKNAVQIMLCVSEKGGMENSQFYFLHLNYY